ncbi:Gfo/Idh/MocA family oxidoreductase [Solibacillus sp. FSL R5-0691]|uniref:Gfo/Idh/MocA family protein n=1 Tax=Solibacillus sp. FSL R5-0691 TaxID=2921653 RepID=UPI0030CEEE64
MKIGIIGTDSTHAIAFSERLQKKGHKLFAYRGGSAIDLSRNRIERISAELNDSGIPFMTTLQELSDICDAFIITSADASQHFGQFADLAALEKPIFIDKPLALNYEQASSIVELANEKGTPLMSCSALRFADEIQLVKSKKSIEAVDIIAPLPMLQELDYFYYGIHAVEMISALKGTSVKDIAVTFNERQHFITFTFQDGTVSSIRGYLQHRQGFQFVTHTQQQSEWFEIAEGDLRFYDRLIDAIEQFFIEKKSPIDQTDMLQTIKLLERITNIAGAH